jgi:hypothetical protein
VGGRHPLFGTDEWGISVNELEFVSPIDTIVTEARELNFISPGGAVLPRPETVWFKALDGHWLNFKHLAPAPDTPDMGPVMLVHGTGVRANLFCSPTTVTLPAMLSAAGFDVWMLNWRSSIDLRPIPWNLDDAAVLDYPAAVKVILQETKKTSLKALVHCQGSTSFLMSMIAGLLPEVTTVVANSSGLYPLLPWQARLKLPIAMKFLAPHVEWFDPQYGICAPGFWPKLMRWLVRAVHHECNNAVCKHASFVYGFGFPTMWDHDNIDAATHDWLAREFAHAPVKLFRQIYECVKAERLISMGEYDDVLPTEFAREDLPPNTGATFHFVTGAQNKCFRPEGMDLTAQYFNRVSASDVHTFHEFPGYGHMDVFFGKNAFNDVYPYMLSQLSS